MITSILIALPFWIVWETLMGIRRRNIMWAKIDAQREREAKRLEPNWIDSEDV